MSRKRDDNREIDALLPGIEKCTCARQGERIRGDLLRHACDYQVTTPFTIESLKSLSPVREQAPIVSMCMSFKKYSEAAERYQHNVWEGVGNRFIAPLTMLPRSTRHRASLGIYGVFPYS